MATSTPISITGVILAGGRARRMDGQDKGLLSIAGRPMIEHVLDALTLKVPKILINANRNVDFYARYRHPVVADKFPDYAGPLAGIAAAMEAATTDYILTVPCDGPLLPHGIVFRFMDAVHAQKAEIATAHSGERLQPVYALLKCSLLPSLNAYLENEGRRIDRWYHQHRLVIVDFSDQPEAFANINTPQDLAAAETRLSQSRAPRENDE